MERKKISIHFFFLVLFFLLGMFQTFSLSFGLSAFFLFLFYCLFICSCVCLFVWLCFFILCFSAPFLFLCFLLSVHFFCFFLLQCMPLFFSSLYHGSKGLGDVASFPTCLYFCALSLFYPNEIPISINNENYERLKCCEQSYQKT